MTLIPIQVTFRGLAHSDALEAAILERVAWLEQHYAGIVRCRVRVELPHRHRRDGRPFHVSIELTVSGHPPIIVSHQPTMHSRLKDIGGEAHRKDTDIETTQSDARGTMHQAFDAVRRRLELLHASSAEAARNTSARPRIFPDAAQER
jgi:hypothetical protein